MIRAWNWPGRLLQQTFNVGGIGGLCSALSGYTGGIYICPRSDSCCQLRPPGSPCCHLPGTWSKGMPHFVITLRPQKCCLWKVSWWIMQNGEDNVSSFEEKKSTEGNLSNCLCHLGVPRRPTTRKSMLWALNGMDFLSYQPHESVVKLYLKSTFLWMRSWSLFWGAVDSGWSKDLLCEGKEKSVLYLI